MEERKKESHSVLKFIFQALFLNEVKPRSVPQINGLRVENFVDFIENETVHGIDFLPENYKEITLNRQWIANLCNN